MIIKSGSIIQYVTRLVKKTSIGLMKMSCCLETNKKLINIENIQTMSFCISLPVVLDKKF